MLIEFSYYFKFDSFSFRNFRKPKLSTKAAANQENFIIWSWLRTRSCIDFRQVCSRLRSSVLTQIIYLHLGFASGDKNVTELQTEVQALKIQSTEREKSTPLSSLGEIQEQEQEQEQAKSPEEPKEDLLEVPEAEDVDDATVSTCRN